MASKNEQITMFDIKEKNRHGPVTCLGMTFNNDEERRAYFTEELRKKLPELKKIEGFPIGEDDDILALSDPPYYTACPNPWINDFIDEWEREKEDIFVHGEEKYHREPFAADVSEGKYDPIYKVHPYPTKVPHKAIMRYILHYTNPGDIVLDGFSGTGMTGVAGQLCGNQSEVESLNYDLNDGEILDGNKAISKLGSRKVILNDLSTSASYISYRYNTSISNNDKENIKKIFKEVEKECSWMFSTLHSKVDKDIVQGIINKFSGELDANTLRSYIESYSKYLGRINYTVWSDVFICTECTSEIVFWETAVDKENGKVKEEFYCPNCSASLTKRNLERAWVFIYDKNVGETVKQIKQIPVLINYSYANSRYEKKPDDYDYALINAIENLDIPYWYPTERMRNGEETRRNDQYGLTHVHHFYTKRNMWVLSSFLNKNEIRLLGFNITRVAAQITKLYRFTYQSGVWGAGGGPLSGTLYVPSLIKELNMSKQLLQAINQQLDVLEKLNNSNTLISTSSFTNSPIKDSSIDYIFIDPPFGGNLMYSELNFFWESWLKVLTNNKKEAIVNTVQEKALEDYRRLMIEAFKEANRILKPGRWLTVEFSNSKASVWNSIQSAIVDAGFIIANVAALDKKKGSFKVVTSTTAVKQDLVITAYKPSEDMINKIIHEQDTENSAWMFVQQHLEKLPVFLGDKGGAQPIVERTPRILFDRMIAYHVQNGLNVPISSAEFQAGIAQRFPMRDGMAFLESQVAEYDKKRILVKEFAQMSLFVSDENSAIEWIRQQLMNKPQTRQDLHPNYMKEIQHIAKHELLPELDQLLEQNFLMFEGNESVPSQIHTYLSTNYKDLRGLDKNDPRLKDKAKNRWYVPDPNKQADLEKLREKSLLREFANYKEELEKSKKKLKQFRTEAIRAGFKKAWGEKDFATIVNIGERLPESVIQEDDKLLMYFDNAQIRLGL